MAGFEPIQETLNKSWRRSPIRGAVLAIKVEEAIQKLLPGWVEMISFKEGRLTLRVPSPSHANEVYIHSRHYTRTLNETLGGKVIEEIKYRIGNSEKIIPESLPA